MEITRTRGGAGGAAIADGAVADEPPHARRTSSARTEAKGATQLGAAAAQPTVVGATVVACPVRMKARGV